MTGGLPPTLLRFGSLRGRFRSSRPLYTEEMALVFGAEVLPLDGRDPAGERFDLLIADQTADSGTEPTAPSNGIWLGGTPSRPVVATEALWAEVLLDTLPARIQVTVRQPDLFRPALHVHFGVVLNKILFLMDHVILRRADQGYLVSGGDERSRLTERTERHFFPDSLPVPARDFAGTPKKEIRMGDFFSSLPYEDFSAHALHFPRVGSRLALHPLKRQGALLRLMKYTSHFQRFASGADQARFLDLLTGFIGTVAAYDLELSPDLGDLERLARALSSAGYRVVDFNREAAPPDVVIHHDFETHFTAFEPPAAGKCIAVRTWDFGPLPPVWAEKINRQFDQYWAYSEWIAEQARAGGVLPERIRVVPLGIDPLVFTPEGSRRAPATEKRFRFLFVGGVSLRKGTDLLLDAYRRAFSREDDVCLVLKDHSGDLFYRENHARERIARMQNDPEAPEVLHLDEFLPETELAALYRSCDVAVFPYRAEGFCLPILEAMACGTPSIAPDFGACLDFCSSDTSYLVKARRIRAPVFRSFSVALGFEEVLSEVDFCELPVERLAEALRAAREAPPEEHQAKVRAGVASARDRMTWEHSGAAARACLAELL